MEYPELGATPRVAGTRGARPATGTGTLNMGRDVLKPGGCALIKVFQGARFEEFLKPPGCGWQG